MIRPFLLSLTLSACLLAADAADSVREAALGWRHGAVKQDKTALQKFLADDLVYRHGSGKQQTKAEYIADVTDGPSHYQSFESTGTNIRILDNVAILVGFVDVTPAKGKPYRVKTFEVYKNNRGQWQLAQKDSARMTP